MTIDNDSHISIEQLLVKMLRKFDDDIEPNPDDDGGIVDLLTAEDIECAE